MKQLHAHAQLGGETEETGGGGGNQLGGHEKHEPVGQCHEPVSDDDVGLAGGIVGGDQVRAETKLATELSGGRFFR